MFESETVSLSITSISPTPVSYTHLDVYKRQVLVIVLIVGIFGGVLTFAIWKIVDEGRMLYTQFPTIYENIQNSTKALGEKWSVVYMNLPSNIQQAITSAGETVSSKAAEFINMKSTPMVDYAGNFAKALPSVFIGIVVFILSSYFMVSENKTVMSTVPVSYTHLCNSRAAC